MTKTTTPLFSFNARGTLKKLLTFRQSPGGTVAEKKPELVDQRTLPQWYHRGDYLDCIALWHQLTPAQKQTYETNARRYHITGYNLFLKETLPDLAHLAGRWHLDEATGSQANDSSNNLNHGTIYGAIHTDGYISKCLSFDGLDDYIQIPHSQNLSPPKITIEYWIFLRSNAAQKDIISKRTVTNKGGFVFETKGGSPNPVNHYLYIEPTWRWTIINYELNQWLHIAVTYDGSYIKGYKNGVSQPPIAATGELNLVTAVLRIGKDSEFTNTLHINALIDEVRIYNICLPPELILEHAQRRY